MLGRDFPFCGPHRRPAKGLAGALSCEPRIDDHCTRPFASPLFLNNFPPSCCGRDESGEPIFCCGASVSLLITGLRAPRPASAQEEPSKGPEIALETGQRVQGAGREAPRASPPPRPPPSPPPSPPSPRSRLNGHFRNTNNFRNKVTKPREGL